MAPDASFLVQGEHSGKAPSDVIVLLAGLGCVTGVRAHDIRQTRTLVHEEQRAGVKAELTLTLEPLQDLLDFEDAAGNGISAENVAVVEELAQTCGTETMLS